ncbi:unnamed protein product [Chilo suppressalis]|uniref:THAP-type domain-containing protein n=1 Tax=Chilo suppressalis TaxID=168631 RepID=A0ABN8LA49_CHISP|nr:unnamed protein product [Chilo suppressalis]
MVKHCCVSYCRSESYAGCGISFHSFPKDEEMRLKWINNGPVKQRVTKNSVVCSLHFEPEDFYSRNSRQLLKPDAIPTFCLKPEIKKAKLLRNMIPCPPPQPPRKLSVDGIEVGVQTDDFTLSSPRITTLKRQIKIATAILKSRDSKIERLKSVITLLKRHKRKPIMIDDIYNIPRQSTAYATKAKRFSNEVKKFACSLYSQSPQAYSLLRGQFVLPHPMTFRKIVSKIKGTTETLD